MGQILRGKVNFVFYSSRSLSLSQVPMIFSFAFSTIDFERWDLSCKIQETRPTNGPAKKK